MNTPLPGFGQPERTEPAVSEVDRLKGLLERRTEALNRTVKELEAGRTALDALIEGVEMDDSGEAVCHDYDRIDDGECALLADLRRIRRYLEGGAK